MSLAARVTVAALAVVALVLGGGGAAIVALAGRQDRDAFDDALRGQLRSYLPALTGSLEGAGPDGGRLPGGAEGARRALADAFGRDDDTRFLRARTAGAPTLVLGTVPSGFPAPASGPEPRSVTAGGLRWRVVTLTTPKVSAELAAREDPLDDRGAALRRIVVLTALVGLGLAALATFAATRFALAPLSELRRKATAARDHRLRVSEPGQPREVAALAAELDGLLERLGASAAEREAALEAARRFAADAGHELRTPLQSLRSNLDSARAGDGAALDGALGQAGRMARLVDALQSLARGEAGLAATGPADLGEIADGAVFAARGRHPALDITLDAPAAGPVVQGDSDGLWRVVENLLENAALHGGPVVRVTVNADPPCLTVDDDGPGVLASERERLLERFARGRDARAPGSGLGLAIVAAEARRHGGALTLSESPLGGLRAAVVLPG